MTIIECQEPVDGKLRAYIVTFICSPNPRSDLGLEIQNGTEPKVTFFAALVVLRVFDRRPSRPKVFIPV